MPKSILISLRQLFRDLPCQMPCSSQENTKSKFLYSVNESNISLDNCRIACSLEHCLLETKLFVIHYSTLFTVTCIIDSEQKLFFLKVLKTLAKLIWVDFSYFTFSRNAFILIQTFIL